MAGVRPKRRRGGGGAYFFSDPGYVKAHHRDGHDSTLALSAGVFFQHKWGYLIWGSEAHIMREPRYSRLLSKCALLPEP